MADAVADIPDYPIVVTHDGQNHVLRIPELYLVETGADLAAAHARIEERRRNLIGQYVRLRATGELPSVGGKGGRGLAADGSLQVFAFKAGIVALAVAIIIATAAFSFAYAVREPLRHSGQKMGRMIVGQIERGLLDAAKIELTPERTAKLRLLVADWAPYAKPYMAELRPLFAELCAPAPGGAGRPNEKPSASSAAGSSVFGASAPGAQ